MLRWIMGPDTSRRVLQPRTSLRQHTKANLVGNRNTPTYPVNYPRWALTALSLRIDSCSRHKAVAD